jgi:hypothetical protein
MELITGHINGVVLAVAVAIFVVYGLVQPARDKASFVQATVKYAPKIQCLALMAIGYGLTGVSGSVAGWFKDGRDWLLDQATAGAEWALGGVGVLALAVASVVLVADYIAPGGLEPNSGKPIGHLVMWLVSLLVYPLLAIALGSLSLFSLGMIFAAMWFFNVKFRGKKRTPAPAASS